jgi:hypothetical protein
MSPTTKAKNVAMSIHEHGLDVHDAATWVRYGLEANVAGQQLVLKALAGK